MILPTFTTQLRARKTNYSLNDCTRGRMASYCSNNTICIIKRRNIKP